MQNVKKNFSRVLSVMLAVAMVLTLNLTSISVKAAVDLPTESTVVSNPAGVTDVQIGGNKAAFYQDDNDTNTYIRFIYPEGTLSSTLKDVEVTITTSAAVEVDGKAITAKDGKSVFNVNLLNNAPVVKIGSKSYILAAGITSGTTVITADNAEAGYVSAATLGGEKAVVKKVVTGGNCPGNIYYAQQNLKWITDTWQISATDITATDIGAVALSYTIGSDEKNTTVNLKPGSVKVNLGGSDYTITGSVKGAFVASAKNFRFDFTELNNSADADEDTKQLGADIATAMDEYYKDTTTQKQFPEGTTNMQVLQTILNWCVKKGLIDEEGTTLGSDVTYVAEINGLGEFSVGNMSGWMYTDDPSNTDATLWPTPAVGGADYVLSPNSTIVWFFTVNYMSHPW